MLYEVITITYEEFMKKIDELERRYRSDEKGFPPGAKEKGLEICEKFRREVRITSYNVCYTKLLRNTGLAQDLLPRGRGGDPTRSGIWLADYVAGAQAFLNARNNFV